MRKLSNRNDYPVQVWREERNQEPEWGTFYQGIFDVTIRHLVSVMFIPSFPRTPDRWPLTKLKKLEEITSEDEARLIMAALADYVVTSDRYLARQVDFFPMPSVKRRVLKRDMAAMFYVTPEEFARFSQELLYIEKNHTLWANQYVPLSVVKDFECMKFILANILPLEQGYKANGGRLIMSGAEIQSPNEVAFMSNGAVVPELVSA